MRKAVGTFAVLGLALGLAGPASADPITGLFNTGVTGAVDTHYTVISGPGITTPQPAFQVTSPPAVYVESPSSNWIWVNASGNATINSPYTFELTFNLTGLNPSTASISGQWAVDDIGSMTLNGTSIGTGLTITGTSPTNFSTFHNFTLTGGFVTGVNHLDFTVTDRLNPGGLNVTGLTGSATAVPEPSSLAMLGLTAVGFVGYSAARRRSARA